MKVALTTGPFSFLRQSSLTVNSCIRSTSLVLNPYCTLARLGFFKLHHRVELKERWSLATRWYGERINSLVSCPHTVLIREPPSTSVKWSLFYSFPTPDNVRRYELKLEHLPLNSSWEPNVIRFQIRNKNGQNYLIINVATCCLAHYLFLNYCCSLMNTHGGSFQKRLL